MNVTHAGSPAGCWQRGAVTPEFSAFPLTLKPHDLGSAPAQVLWSGQGRHSPAEESQMGNNSLEGRSGLSLEGR